MKKLYIDVKIIGLIIVIMLVVFSISFVINQQGIEEINKDIEGMKLKGETASVRVLADASSGTSPLVVNFKPLLLNVEGDVEYSWDFGDGNTSTETNPAHTYRGSGIFSCKLIIENADVEIMDSFNVTVFPNNPPKVKIICDTIVNRPAKVTFDVEAFDPEGEELEYHWTLKYPPLFGYQKEELYDTKSFAKTFIRDGQYNVELIVNDEAGNQVIDYEKIQVQKHQLEQFVNGVQGLITFHLPLLGETLWKIPFFEREVSKYLDEHWLEWPQVARSIVSAVITIMNFDYEPPIPKADLEWNPEIINIDVSAYVDGGGVVQPEAENTSSFVLMNNDSLNTAESIYISLDNPFSDEKGLNDTIAVENLTLALDSGVKSNALFYNGDYTNYKNSYYIEKIAPGDLENIGITVRLKEGAKFTKGTYYDNKLYVYQSKYLDKAEYVDEIPFTIII